MTSLIYFSAETNCILIIIDILAIINMKGGLSQQIDNILALSVIIMNCILSIIVILANINMK